MQDTSGREVMTIELATLLASIAVVDMLNEREG
jgi:hypothetical protein